MVGRLPAPRALYVHVPFCPSVCPYCDFHKMRRHDDLVARYMARVVAEIAALGADHAGPLDTVYFGGGTPSWLTDAELEALVAAIDAAFGWPGRLETTLEADPLTFHARRAQRFADLGFSRLSIGVQSTDPETLGFLGRIHRGAEALSAVEAGLAAGLRVNADVMLGVPGQDAPADLRRVAETGVSHVSTYGLTVEAHTPFAFRGVRVDPDQDADDYDAALTILGEAGLERYEVSNHARAGHESLHNLSTWRGEPYLAVGPGATAFVPVADEDARTPAEERLLGIRARAPLMRAWLHGGPPAEVVEVDAGRYVEDVLMTGLRTREGVDLDALAERAGIDPMARHGRVARQLTEDGLLERTDETLRATDRGLLVLNRVVGAFLARASDGPPADDAG